MLYNYCTEVVFNIGFYLIEMLGLWGASLHSSVPEDLGKERAKAIV